uniref:Uncharacterized protein n=1 Tax=Panagrolaimus sp. ES5 TaxID=591445 RepID=A0AC34FH84_9BILA
MSDAVEHPDEVTPREDDEPRKGVLHYLKEDIKEGVQSLKEGVTKTVEKIGEVNGPQDQNEVMVDAGSIL